MIGLDTDILVRYLTQDDEIQACIVNKIINKYENQQSSLFINNIVLCELIRVLERGYKYNKKDIIKVLKLLYSSLEFVFESSKILWSAISNYEKYNADFSDILFGKVNQSYNCIYTITLDHKASILNEFNYAANTEI